MMRTQRLPPLSVFLTLLSVLITPALLSAQQMDALASRTSGRSPGGLSTQGSSDSFSSLSIASKDAAAAVDVHVRSASIGKISNQDEFAVAAFTGILAQYRKMGNREAEAQTLCALANSYNALHRQQKAVEDFQSALAIWRELGNKDGEASTLTYIGNVYRAWGFPEEAIRFYRDALKVYPASHKTVEEAAILDYLGLSFFQMGDKKKCVSYLDRALASYQAMQDRQGEAFTLTNLGSAYGFLLNNPHKSLDYFQEAITKLELLNDRESEANALELMGELWLKLAKPEMAAISFQHALTLFSQTGNAEGEASARKHLKALDEAETVASSH